MADADPVDLAFNRDKAPPPGPHEKKSYEGRCHCRRIRFKITLPTASLPLRGLICHCSTCRYTHGTLGSFNVILPPGVEPEWAQGSSSDKLAGYERPGGKGRRFFCPDCGSHVGHIDPTCGQWGLACGVFDEKFWQLGFHTYPKSAAGGGMADWVTRVAGDEVLHLSPGDQDSPGHCLPEVGPDGEERLRAECCCGGVSFWIPRPSQGIIKDDYMGMYVSPSDPRKWKAFLDMCRDCGRISGTGVVPWLMVPRIAIEPAMPADLNIGTIRTYKSSEQNTRGFCGVCGSTMLLGTTHRMPTARQAILNVAMGVLRAPEGVRAENWVTWRTGRIAWAEDARSYDADLTDALVAGHREWGIQAFGEALDFAVI